MQPVGVEGAVSGMEDFDRSVSEGRLCPSGCSSSVNTEDSYSEFFVNEQYLPSTNDGYNEALEIPIADLDAGSEIIDCMDYAYREFDGMFDEPRSRTDVLTDPIQGDGMRKFVIDHSVSQDLCTGRCSHFLGGLEVQLNKCSFYRELYLNGQVDANADYIFHGISHGFNIVDPDCPAEYFRSNYNSIKTGEARRQMNLVVQEELASSKVSKVVSQPKCVHALGAIMKSSGKIRPITDCRRPLQLSINNYMTTTWRSFRYTTVDDVCESLAGNEYMAVLDIKSAYRSVNVAVAHRQFQGFCWDIEDQESMFTDNCLCFGLSCAPFIFTQLTEFIIRCMNRRGFERVFGYIDDFLIIGQTREECQHGLDELICLLRSLGFYISWDKLILPAQKVRYLGIMIDSTNMELSLPQNKLVQLKELVRQFLDRTHANKRQILSLAGLLSHCTKVVRGGRTFSRRVINLANFLPELHSIVCLPEWFRDDLKWWDSFVKCFNGKAGIIKNLHWCDRVILTDASFTGFGGWFGDDWFAGVWSMRDHPQLEEVHEDNIELGSSELTQVENINILELWPVICAIRRWGPLVSNRQLLLRSDNLQVVRMIMTGRSRDRVCMNWLRELFWLTFVFNIQIVAFHIKSSDNVFADMLSRLSDSSVMNKFRSLCV